MSDALKVLIDDHLKVNRLFRQFGPGGSDYALAREICKELTIHAQIEEDVLYPVLRDQVDAGKADQSEQEHEEIKELVAVIEGMEPDDPDLGTRMLTLQTTFQHHAEEEENEVFPLLDQKLAGATEDLGVEIYRRRTELMQETS